MRLGGVSALLIERLRREKSREVHTPIPIEQQDGHAFFNTTRVETFTDGVFAIIITLLVLNLSAPKLPEDPTSAQLWRAVGVLMPKFASWAISFLIVCIVWINHHRVFSMFRGIDRGLFWYNALLMFWMSFIPFPTAFLGDHPYTPSVVAFYGVSNLLTSLSFSLIRLYGARHKELLREDVDYAVYVRGTWLSIIYGPVMYGVGALLALVWLPGAYVLYTLIPAYFITGLATKRAAKVEE